MQHGHSVDASGDVANLLSTFSPGSALPQALRLARCQAAQLFQCDVDKLPNESKILDQGILRGEASILAFNGKVVMALEDLYSWRKKDRTSRKSQLSHAESLRFHRAIYRIWLMSFTYGMGSITGDPGRWDGDDDPESRLKKCRSKQRKFLEKYTSTELHEIRMVALFLGSLAAWAIAVEGSCLGSLDVYDFHGLYQFAGPRAILECYEGVTVEPLHIGYYVNDDGPYTGFLLEPLKEILDDRKASHLPDDLSYYHIILDRIIGENDPCQHCGSTTMLGIAPLDLYNKTNWDHIEGLLKLDFDMYFKGNLWKNRAEKGLHDCLRALDNSTIIGEMVDNQQNSNWTKEGWACFDCLSMFFTDMLPVWWLERKRKAGITIMKDCPYGYDCDKQMWEKGLKHAESFNHLCEPTQRKTGVY